MDEMKQVYMAQIRLATWCILHLSVHSEPRYHQTWEVSRRHGGLIEVLDSASSISPPALSTAQYPSAPLRPSVKPTVNRETTVSLIKRRFQGKRSSTPYSHQTRILLDTTSTCDLVYAICVAAAAARLKNYPRAQWGY